MNRRLTLLALPLLLSLATACTADPENPAPAGRGTAAARPSPFEGCAGLTDGPAEPSVSEVTGDPLPELTLTCFTGGTPVALRDIRGPAVVNIWASWCPPCRKELPAFQRLHERADGQLRVIGVNSRDSREGAQAIGEDFGVRFPMLVDQGEAVQRALRRNAVPLTVLVDVEGRIRHIDSSGALDDARLAELVRRHLGLTVPA
ncbi:TlpA family protein disulfide reductase [Micromonospora sp. HNM0581]|uniref:TlpA family protein disulfide reductase n=1 Tax=Micromonospora sp. HNM0581 TaxID=2716341 RepID=UPI00146DAF98|nr:TlpA disulfide reductase family protein [Micromonospora sp. HNM0581]NLU80295.1 TlpA family protein disulfide reductase [Micromonospora sp. HNM0581]